MLKTILAAAAAIAASSVALPAMAQCTGDQMLTSNPDGTTTCGDGLVQIVPESQAPYSNPFATGTAPAGAGMAIVEDQSVLWLDQGGSVVATEVRDTAPGDGKWEPSAYDLYSRRASYYTDQALKAGVLTFGLGTAAVISAPTWAGPAVFGAGAGVTTGLGLVYTGLANHANNLKEAEFGDWMRHMEQCMRSGCDDTAFPPR